MSSTILGPLSLTVQSDKSSVGKSPKVGYQKVDIDFVKQQENKSINGAIQQQPYGITNGHVPLTNGIEKEDQTNGIETWNSEKTVSKLESEINGIATNQQTTDNRFHRLPKPQQEILLLHGPRQRYRLEKARDIPELRSDQEILVQVGKNLERISTIEIPC